MKTQSLFGKIAAATHEKSFGAIFVLLRIVTGLMFFLAGWSKVTTSWSAEAYLLSANGPFADWFHALAGNSFVDALNAWGLLLLGVALIFGILVRPASVLGAVLMVLYYLAHFPANTAHGYIEYHIILVLILALFATGGAGHAFGLNEIILGNIRKPKQWITFLFG